MRWINYKGHVWKVNISANFVDKNGVLTPKTEKYGMSFRCISDPSREIIHAHSQKNNLSKISNDELIEILDSEINKFLLDRDALLFRRFSMGILGEIESAFNFLKNGGI